MEIDGTNWAWLTLYVPGPPVAPVSCPVIVVPEVTPVPLIPVPVVMPLPAETVSVVVEVCMETDATDCAVLTVYVPVPPMVPVSCAVIVVPEVTPGPEMGPSAIPLPAVTVSVVPEVVIDSEETVFCCTELSG